MTNTQTGDWRQATDLTDKTVVITGVGSGIGRATARTFASAGARLIGGDVDEARGAQTMQEIRQAGGQATFLPLDLSNGERVDAFVDAAVAALGDAPDIIANVAGVDRVMPFVKNTPDIWDLLIRVNYVGPVRMIHRFLPAMIERRRGKIIMVASDAGRVGSSGETFYAGTKGAVIAFTKSLAREVARSGITCNCVAPGPTDTPLFNNAIDEKLREALIRAIPLKRLADPAEIAHTIVYFATPATDYMTGQVVSVSGGLTMHG